MTQAVDIRDAMWQQVGPDMMLTGYLPSSAGLAALDEALSNLGRKTGSSGGGSESGAGVAASKDGGGGGGGGGGGRAVK
jgi:diaminohydroxyphosphoribosylaminopyrimidine deaminase/5-amino-6-(5-phosphoribosylamino)uracil reductase